MKKIILWLLYSSFLYSAEAISDPYKGQVYYKYFVGSQLEIDGIAFTKKFTQKEWKELYANGGGKFFKEFPTLSKESIADDVLIHLEAFSLFYAKDSDATPNCGD